MFGQDKSEDKNKKDDDQVQPIGMQPVNNGLLGIDDDQDSNTSGSNAPSAPAMTQDSSASTINDNVFEPTPAPNSDIKAPSDNSDSPINTAPAAASDNDLLSIKREALQELSPLIDHLEQDSEEKFRTTMMMIQASDSKDLIPQAFQAAKDIADNKKRAQALLDIVNEINYFTHKTDD